MVKKRAQSNTPAKCNKSCDDGDEMPSKSCEDVACVMNDGTNIRTVKANTKALKVKGKRGWRAQSKNDGDVSQNKTEKVGQTRRKVVSQDVPQRRSPRNTVEAREARSKSRSLRFKELHYIGVDVCGQLSEEKQALAALYLSEINRKLCSTGWKQNE